MRILEAPLATRSLRETGPPIAAAAVRRGGAARTSAGRRPSRRTGRRPRATRRRYLRHQMLPRAGSRQEGPILATGLTLVLPPRRPVRYRHNRRRRRPAPGYPRCRSRLSRTPTPNGRHRRRPRSTRAMRHRSSTRTTRHPSGRRRQPTRTQCPSGATCRLARGHRHRDRASPSRLLRQTPSGHRVGLAVAAVTRPTGRGVPIRPTSGPQASTRTVAARPQARRCRARPSVQDLSTSDRRGRHLMSRPGMARAPLRQ
jgi:hypothetical protein